MSREDYYLVGNVEARIIIGSNGLSSNDIRRFLCSRILSPRMDCPQTTSGDLLATVSSMSQALLAVNFQHTPKIENEDYLRISLQLSPHIHCGWMRYLLDDLVGQCQGRIITLSAMSKRGLLSARMACHQTTSGDFSAQGYYCLEWLVLK